MNGSAGVGGHPAAVAAAEPSAPVGAVVSATALWREALVAALAALDQRSWAGVASIDALGPGDGPEVIVTTRVSTAEAATRRWPATRAVVLAVEETGPLAERTPGAISVLAPEASGERLRTAVQGRAGAGRRSWQPTRLAPPPLTPRERLVMEGVAAGRNAREIAATMGVSIRTVEAYKQQVFAKWSVRSQSQAVELALRHGLITVRSA